MQVEGSNYPSSRQITTSLIAPSATAPPPKFVLLSSTQNGNGNVKYKIGLSVEIADFISLEELFRALKTPFANGNIGLHPESEHLHVFGRSTANDSYGYGFHFVIENAPSGKTVADIAAISEAQPVGHLSGFAQLIRTDGEGTFVKCPIDGFSATANNALFLETFNGNELVLDLGPVTNVVLEVGNLDRTGKEYVTRRDEQCVRVFPRTNAQVDHELDPYLTQPIATLPLVSDPAGLTHNRDVVPLQKEIAAGNISPASGYGLAL